MKIIFAGTPEFAASALTALIHSPHEIIAVLTQPDRKAGRGLKLQISPVKAVAQTYELPIYQPNSLKDSEVQALLVSLQADVMVVAAYGLLLPADVLKIPRLGCINIHPSLLPRWRGAAPIPRTIAAGDAITGVTIMQMDQGLDTGPILLQRQYVLNADETAETLHDQLAQLGSVALLEVLEELTAGTAKAHPQNNELATYAQKITKEEALIDWALPATTLEQMIRAFNPWPVAYTTWQGQTLRIWQAKAFNHDPHLAPRTIALVAGSGIDVATGKGLLRLQTVQLPGGKILSAQDFYNAKHRQLKVGEHFI